MNKEQSYTPKYWVGHNKVTHDVLLSTADKSKDGAILRMRGIFGKEWFENEDLSVDLMKIKFVSIGWR